MRIRTMIFGAVLLTQSPVLAQHEKVTEFGFNILSIDMQEGVTTFTTPGSGLAAMSGLYISALPSESLMITIQPNLTFSAYEGSSALALGLGAQVAFFLGSGEGSRPFLAGNVSLQSASAGGYSDSGIGVGGSIGLREKIGTSFSVRPEIRYMRWLSYDEGTLSLCLSVGAWSVKD